MIVETEAVVLHSMNYRDTSKIVTLYSRKYGKIKIIAKGAKNQKTNKFGSSLEPMTHSSVVIYKKEHHDLHLLSKSEIVTPLNRIQADSEKMFTGLALIELMNMVMHDEEENEQIFTMLVGSLKAIDAADKNSLNVLLAFMVKMFDQFGFGLSLEACVNCSRKTDENNFPSVLLRLSDGKCICPHCSPDLTTTGTKISGGLLKSLYYFQINSIEKSSLISFNDTAREDIISILQSFLRYHIDGVRTLKSLSLLHSIY
ncbi:MAG: DNA repair protein RecO [Bacteroidota bacterium]